MARASYFMILDTEGVDTIRREDDQPNPSSGLFYDLACIVVEAKTGAIVERYNAINMDTMANVELMRTAYYANKLPEYYAAMERGDIETASTLEIMRRVRDLIRQYKVKEVWAYNAHYDRAITNSTVKAASNGFVGFFMPYGVEWRDIWDYADCITSTPSYLKFAERNELFTASGNPSTSADSVLKFLKGLDAEEQHTALSDCLDELVIYLAAKGKHCKKSRSMGQGWRKAAKAYKDMKK